MTFFALVRHGETDWNRQGRLQGSSDVPLNETGRAQARDAALELRGRNWTTIVSSPLVRAAETADIIAADLGLTVADHLSDLRERHYGAAEGMTEYDAYDEFGGWFPGLEPRRDVAERATRALGKVQAEYPDNEVIVVAHGGVIRAMLDVFLRGYRAPRIVNAGISTVTVEADRARVRSINGRQL